MCESVIFQLTGNETHQIPHISTFTITLYPAIDDNLNSTGDSDDWIE